MPILITKVNGEQEPFDPHKLNTSLSRAGAKEAVRKKIINRIKKALYNGITTQEIYEHAFDLLRKENTEPTAARYSIKRAVLDLGPSGFPFERFVGEIFRTVGYSKVRVGVAMQGKCAPHEVDLVGLHNGKRIAAEIKFHNSPGIKTDLKVALYVRARFDDLNEQVDEGWLITNTRFTRNAIRYGRCARMQMLGWDYPHDSGIERLIDQARVHPITALTTLSKEEKRRLLEADIVLCRQILDNKAILRYVGIHGNVDKIINEISGLCEAPKN